MNNRSRISVIMTPYNRDHLLEKTLPTIKGADEFVIEPDDRPHKPGEWLNPAPIINRAMRKATGDILIFQPAECFHVNDVVNALARVPRGQCWFASCRALKEDGSFDRWYCHPDYRRTVDFFCGAIWAKDMLEYNEQFVDYGWENDELRDRLLAKGIQFQWLYPEEALVHHQWHPPFVGPSQSRALYERLKVKQ